MGNFLYTDGPIPEETESSANQAYANIVPTLGERFGAETGTTTGQAWHWLKRTSFPTGHGNYIDPDEANKRYAPEDQDGKPTKLFDQRIQENDAESIGRAKANEIEREGILSRYGGAHSWVTNLGVGAVGFMLDPIQAGATFLPGIGEEAIMARLGTDFLSKTVARGASGAVSGGGAMVPIAAMKYGIGQTEASDYDLRSAFADIAGGAMFAAVMHAGIMPPLKYGWQEGRMWLAEQGIFTPRTEPVPVSPDDLRAMVQLGQDRSWLQHLNSIYGAEDMLGADAATRRTAMQSALSQVMDGRPVDVSAIFPDHGEAARNIDPQAFQEFDSLAAEQRGGEPVEAAPGASAKAVSVADIIRQTAEEILRGRVKVQVADRINITEGKGSLFSFAGEKAATADLEALAQARRMTAEHVSRDEIWTKTGWFQGVDGKWRFEIDDSGAKLAGEEYLGGGVSGFTGLEHPGFTKAYGEMPPIYGGYEAGKLPSGSYHGAYGDNPAHIEAQAGNAADARSITLHELQHATQSAEDFAKGGAWSNLRQTPEVKALAEAKYQEMKARGADLSEQDMRWNADSAAAREIYNRLSGEVEARNVQSRMNMTAAERRATPPWLTQDVPDEQQIVRESRLPSSDDLAQGGMFARADDYQKRLYQKAAWAEDIPTLRDSIEEDFPFARSKFADNPEALKAIDEMQRHIEDVISGIRGESAFDPAPAMQKALAAARRLDEIGSSSDEQSRLAADIITGWVKLAAKKRGIKEGGLPSSDDSTPRFSLRQAESTAPEANYVEGIASGREDLPTVDELRAKSQALRDADETYWQAQGAPKGTAARIRQLDYVIDTAGGDRADAAIREKTAIENKYPEIVPQKDLADKDEIKQLITEYEGLERGWDEGNDSYLDGMSRVLKRYLQRFMDREPFAIAVFRKAFAEATHAGISTKDLSDLAVSRIANDLSPSDRAEFLKSIREFTNRPDPVPALPPPPGQTQTPEFERWFGHSKAVDADGKPLVVYHGTNADFEAFDPARADGGIFFSSGTATPNHYAMRAGEGANVIPAYVKIERPAPTYQAFLDDPKYDGYFSHQTYVVRNPEQVKSVFNRGTFDPNDPRISYGVRQGAEGVTAEGRFDPQQNLITISADALDPVKTLKHESVHALRSMGLFTDKEWGTLENAARKQGWMESNNVRALYEGIYGGRTGDEVFSLRKSSSGTKLTLQDVSDDFQKGQAGRKVFNIDSDGEPIATVYARVTPEDPSTLYIGNIRSEGGTNSIGPQLKQVIDLIKAQYPEIKRIGGFRKGARATPEDVFIDIAKPKLGEKYSLIGEGKASTGPLDPKLEGMLLEEAIAEQFSLWRQGASQVTGTIAKLFERIQQFLDRIGNALRGQGFQTADDVFAAMRGGDVAGRAKLARKAEVESRMAELEPRLRAAYARAKDARTLDLGKIANEQRALYRDGFAQGMPQEELKQIMEEVYGSANPSVTAAAAATEAGAETGKPAGGEAAGGKAGTIAGLKTEPQKFGESLAEAKNPATARTEADRAAEDEASAKIPPELAAEEARLQQMMAEGYKLDPEEAKELAESQAALQAADLKQQAYSQAAECLIEAGL